MDLVDLVDKFDAKGKSGSSYHVLVFQNPVTVQKASGDVAELLGPKTYQLSDGRALHPLSDTKFEIIHTNEEIFRV